MDDDDGEFPRSYTLKFLLAGDSDVGKDEILLSIRSCFKNSKLVENQELKTTVAFMQVDGIQVKALLWDAPGQGRFNIIYQYYSRGAQGVFLVYDITNRWSFNGLDRWIEEMDKSAPGVPKILIGNRLHLAFNRVVSEVEAECYASKHKMPYFEVSSVCNFNVMESCSYLVRSALFRVKMSRRNREEPVACLLELCCLKIVSCTTVYGVDRLDLPSSIKQKLKSYSGLYCTKQHFPCSANSYKKHLKRKLCNVQ